MQELREALLDLVDGVDAAAGGRDAARVDDLLFAGAARAGAAGDGLAAATLALDDAFAIRLHVGEMDHGDGAVSRAESRCGAGVPAGRAFVAARERAAGAMEQLASVAMAQPGHRL